MPTPELSIIIPTHNERDNINPLIARLRTHHRKAEIIVVDSGHSSDGTLESITESSVVKLKSNYQSRAVQMHLGASAAKSQLLYFVHADTRPPLDYLDLIQDSFAKGNDFGLFSYRFDSDSKLLAFNSSFTREPGLFTGGGDQSMFIRKATYFEQGGFNTLLPIMEDFDFYWRLRDAGIPFTLIPRDIIISARKYARNSYLRIQLVNLYTLLGFKWGRSPVKLKRLYSKVLK
jgi:rSAM/selenodomain-associated transferase 2